MRRVSLFLAAACVLAGCGHPLPQRGGDAQARATDARVKALIAKLGPGSERLADMPSPRTESDNAADELAYIGSPAVSPLIALLDHPGKDPGYWRQGKAIEILGKIRDRRAVQPLIQVLRQNRQPSLRASAARSLGMLKDRAAVPVLIAATKDEDPYVRMDAADSLGQIGDSRAVPALVELLGQTAIGDPSRKADPGWVAEAALGKLAPGSVPPLIAALRSRSAMVRQGAVGALGQCKDRSDEAPLLGALRRDPDEEVREAAARAMVGVRPEVAVPALVAATHDRSGLVRQAAVQALGDFRSPAGLAAVRAAMRDKDLGVRCDAATALGQIGTPDAIGVLAGQVRAKDRDVRMTVANALGQTGKPAAIQPLLPLLTDRDREVRTEAAKALGQLKAQGALEPLLVMVRADPAGEVREAAAKSLGLLGDRRATKPLLGAMSDGWESVRDAAVTALQALKDPSAIPALLALTGSRKADIRRGAICVLGEIPSERSLVAARKALSDPDPNVGYVAREAVDKLTRR